MNDETRSMNIVDGNPRRRIWKLVQTNLRKLLAKTGELHGHYCPFLALGVKAGARGVKELGVAHEGMEKVIALVETNNCFSDGIQYATGCTFGNNALIYRDYGKTAVTLAQRKEKNGVRITVKSDASEKWEEKYPKYEELFNKVVKERSGNKQEKKEMMKLSRKIAFTVIKTNFHELFTIEDNFLELPEYAPIFESFTCSKCDESVMATRIVEKEGEKLCIPCAREKYYELDGRGIHLAGK